MYPKLRFVFDKEKDLYNIWNTANSNSRFMDFSKNMPKKWVEICKGKSYKECKKELINEVRVLHDSKLINIFIDAIQKSWDSVEEEYFKRLEKITGKKIKSKNVTVYLTTVGRCPYDNEDYKYFYVSYFSSLAGAMNTCAHELMHFNFHQYFWEDIEDKMGKEKTSDLKESLTMLINLEFNDLWFVGDHGYEIHKDIRQFIAKEWIKEKDFKKLLDKCVGYMKKRD